METASIVFEHSFDEETLAEFSSLRTIRLCLAEKQLANLDKTIDEMISRKLISRDKRESCRQELEDELSDKIATLRARNASESNQVFVDEIEFYLGLVEDESMETSQLV